MTPSLPVPHESAPDDPERPDESAQTPELLILPPRPPLPTDVTEHAETAEKTDAPTDAAIDDARTTTGSGSPSATQSDRPRKPKGKGKGRGKRRPAAKADPGPPPPLPPDVVATEVADEVVIDGDIAVPPKPPLPAAALASTDIEIDVPPPPPPPVPAGEVAAAVVTVEEETETVPETDAAADDVAVVEETVEAKTAETVAADTAEPEAAEAEREVEVEAAEVTAPEVDDAPTAKTEAEEPRTVGDDLAEAALAEAALAEAPAAEPEAPSAPHAPAPAASVVVEPEPLGHVPAVLTVTDVDPAQAALVLRGVSKSFGGALAVDGVDLTVPAGTFYGLVGPNGAGKTTTLSMISGLLRPDRGSVHVTGIDVRANPRGAKRRMGVLPDRLRTFDRLTGRQLLYYYGVLRGLPAAVVESRTADLARAFDLTDALGRVVADYSAGMAKKVMLAGAMIHSPRLLVLDEPFEAVDPVSSAIILDILSTYVAHGGTVILSSHGMELVERVCSRVAVLVAGQVLAEGTIDEVRGELTLEQRFIELAGGLSDVEGLEWLHTFSD